MKKIDVSNLVLEELIRIRLNEQTLDDYDVTNTDTNKTKTNTNKNKTNTNKNKTNTNKTKINTDTTKTKTNTNFDEDGWDTSTTFFPKQVAEKLYNFKGSFFGGPSSPDGYITYIIKNIATAKQWEDVDKELKKLSGGKGIFSYGRSFIDDDDTQRWNKLLNHVKKIYPKKLETFVYYLGTDTYKKYLGKTTQNAKIIAQQIYDSKGFTDNETKLIAAIKMIPNANVWSDTNKQLQILTGEKGIFSYIRSFIRQKDTKTWTPILTHIRDKKLVSTEKLRLFVQLLGGPFVYPGILSDADNEKATREEIEKIDNEDEKNNNTFGGDTGIMWGIGILAAMGVIGKIFGFTVAGWLTRTGLKWWKTRGMTAAEKEVAELNFDRPGTIRRAFQRVEEFITRGILGNTGSLRRMIRRLQRQGLMTETEARQALSYIQQNRYAIASEIRKTHMKAVIKQFMTSGNKTEQTVQNILRSIPRTGPSSEGMIRRYGIILRRIVSREERSLSGQRGTQRRPRTQPEPYQRNRIGFNR
jgi:hypothetical protein